MKSCFLALFLVFILNCEISAAATPIPAPPAELRALEIRFFGGLTGFDDAAYHSLRSLIASLLSDGTIDQFKTSYWGREGGSSFCIELSPTAKVSVEQVSQMLATIRPRDSSVYQYVSAVKCQ